MKTTCAACGNYLLPCTATATGIHPTLSVAGPRRTNGENTR